MPGANLGRENPAQTPVHAVRSVYIGHRKKSSKRCKIFTGKTFLIQLVPTGFPLVVVISTRRFFAMFSILREKRNRLQELKTGSKNKA